MDSETRYASIELARFPIAITGIGCRLPGGINSPDALWRNLCAGVDAVVPTPADRWNTDAFYSPDITAPGRSVSRFGGFLDDIDEFDCRFFGVSPREAMRIDPQQRLLLQTTWEAFEDAGTAVDELADSDTGVFIGVSYCDFATIQGRDLENADGHSGTGSGLSLTANRISHRLGLRGPSVAVDTACSSSLVAIDLACHAVWTGQSRMAIAGGVNLILSPETSVFLSKGAMLSPDGRCYSFDARANGYVRGEGVGIVVLKPLEQALADGDRIYAVVRATATNQDGRTPSVTQPDVDSQVAVIREACRRANVTPEEISYVEAHGTGTPVGDPIELNAIARAIGRKSSPVTVGSIKTNIGHLESASGVAGLIKAALCISHRKIPQNLNFEQPNPNIDFSALNVRIPIETLDWQADSGQLLAGVNSFGFGGTNAHVILSELPEVVADDVKHHDSGKPRDLLFPVSAATQEGLHKVAKRLIQMLEASEFSGIDIANALTTRRSHLEYRAVFADSSVDGLRDKLRAYVDGNKSIDIVAGRVDPDPRAVFVFVGQGSQWSGMGRDLLQQEPVFRDTIQHIDALFCQAGGFSILSMLSGDIAEETLDRTEVSQPLIFAVQVALAELWKSWGIMPSAVIGHSVGEVAAACVSGALSLEDAVTVIHHRSRLQQGLHGQGRMMVVTMPLSEVESLLDDTAVEVAAVNSSTAITLAGEQSDLDKIRQQLADRQIACRYINTEYAFHSHQMDPLRDELVECLAGIKSETPTIPMMSTVTGAWVAAGDVEAEYWWNNVRNIVQFATGTDQIIAADHALFVEVGPHSALAGSLIESLDENECPGTILQSMTRGESGVQVMRRTLCTLYTRGFQPNWAALNPRSSEFVKLPTYPWENEAFWQEGHGSRSFRFRQFAHPLLGERVQSAGTLWKNDISLRSHSYIGDHNLGGDAVYPGAAYIEMMFAAGNELFGDDIFEVTDVRFAETLYLEEEAFEQLETRYDISRSTLEIHSRKKDGTDPWILKASASLRRAPARTPSARPAESGFKAHTEIGHEQFYKVIGAEHANFGVTFRGVQKLLPGSGETRGVIELPEEISAADLSSYVFHPALLDACIQCARGLMPFDDGDRIINQIPIAARRISLYGKPTRCLEIVMRERTATDQVLHADLEIYDEAGMPVAILEDLAYVRIPRISEKSVARKLYKTEWHARQLAEDAAASIESGTWILLADSQGLASALATELRSTGCRCIMVNHGDVFDRPGPDELVLRSDSKEDVRRMLQDLDKECEDLRGFVHFWNLDIEIPEALTPDALVAGQRLGCVSVLHLVQEILDTGLMDRDDAPELLLVTRGAKAVDTQANSVERGIHPVHETVWGLSRVINNELGAFRCRIVDLEPGAEDILPVLTELTLTDGEAESAWRGGQRLVNRLVSQRADQLPPKLLPANDGDQSRPFRIALSTPGSFGRLGLSEIEYREPARGEIRVRVQTAGLNFRDVMAALGLLPDEAEEDPAWQALGLECVGIVDAVGPEVRDFDHGDRVLVSARHAFATHIVVDAGQAAVVPAHLSSAEAASIPVAFSTAYLALTRLGNLCKTDKVLIHAAAGGVGLAAVQICQLAGAEIFATAGNDEKRDYLRSLGVEHVMDSRSLDFAEEIMRITSGRGVDVVLNSLSGDFLHHSLEVLAPFGRFLEIGKRDIYENNSLGMSAFKKSIRFFGIDVAKIFQDRQDIATSVMQELMDLFDEKTLQPLPVKTYPVSQAADAFRDMSQAKHMGKLVLDFDDPAARIVGQNVGSVLLAPDASYLVTGGLSGFGLRVAKWLVDKGARHIVLTGRSGKVRECDVAQFDELESSGASIKIVASDVSDAAAVQRLIADIDNTGHPLRGVFHAAALFHDSVIFNMDQESFEEVLAPKLLGGWNLHRATRDKPLDMFVLFSSLSADFGTPGQSNYAAANAFLCGLARYRHSEGLPAIAVKFGAIGETGFISRNSDVARLLGNLGVQELDPDSALESLDMLLSTDVTEMTVASVDWTRMSSSTTDVPLRRRLSLLAESHGNSDIDHRQQIMHELGTVAPEQAVAILEMFLRHEVARILGLRFDAVETDRPLQDLGLDSLAIFELKNSLEFQGFLKIPVSKLKTHPTISNIAKLVLNYIDTDPADGDD